MRRLLVVVAVLSVSGCLCSGPPKGECTGTWGGVTLDKAVIDPESRLLITARQTCLVSDLKTYELSWKSKAVSANFGFHTGGPSSLTPVNVAVPDGGTFETYSLTPDVAGATGNIHLIIIGILGRRAGSINLTAGTDRLDCDFEVPYVKEGSGPSCGGGGDGD